MDRDWHTKYFEQDDLKKTITHAHVSVKKSTGVQGKDGTPSNHWAVFFETSPSHSVCFNMVLSDDESDELRGTVFVASKSKYDFDRQAFHTLSFPIKGTPTIEDMANIVNKNGLHRYRFNTDGQGCRFWVCTFISHLEKEGFVESGCADQTWADAAYYYIDPSGRELRELTKGIFMTSTD
ncbi:hypothetical protein E4U31_007311 [Claviceps sp. LM219 group G6]|nr:hypothetical protein E4U15_004781 [Claviceps sp. LM218 group G6]KAG6091195.1 hypothetical protein E4U31_007311 [Claviceps sp. LM219 group G6]